MEPANLQPFRRDPPEQDPTPARSEERVSAYDLMVVEGDLEGLDRKKEEMHKIFEQMQEKASSVLEFSLKWEEIDEQYGSMGDSLKQRALEMDLKEKSVMERFVELEARKEEVALLSKLIDDKSCDLEMKVKDFDLKQTAETQRRREEAELIETSVKQLEARENELKLLKDIIKEKSTELEKKEEHFQLKQQAESREIDVKSKFLELKEKKLEEREKELDLKLRGLKERSIQAKTCKRSRLQSEPSLFAEKGRDVESFICPGKKQKLIIEHNHNDEDKETDIAFIIPTSLVQISEPHEGEFEEAVSIDGIDEDHEPSMCVDSEFNDFSKTMSSFVAGQVWALYDGIDSMPRLYARIKKVTKSQSSLHVTWLEPKDEESEAVACGRFKWGITETIKSHLAFSHVMHPIIHGRNFIAVIPRKGETWALFRDWSKSWNNYPEQHKPPYRYDFVEVLLNFDDCLGVGVAYLGKVEGFVSVFKQAGQHGVVSLMVTPEEMHRFSQCAVN